MQYFSGENNRGFWAPYARIPVVHPQGVNETHKKKVFSSYFFLKENVRFILTGFRGYATLEPSDNQKRKYNEN